MKAIIRIRSINGSRIAAIAFDVYAVKWNSHSIRIGSWHLETITTIMCKYCTPTCIMNLSKCQSLGDCSACVCVCDSQGMRLNGVIMCQAVRANMSTHQWNAIITHYVRLCVVDRRAGGCYINSTRNVAARTQCWCCQRWNVALRGCARGDNNSDSDNVWRA